ncbi:integrase family protein [Anaeromyxobacter dehalogenans 2CP-1]|uniref:Integrase family protein n=1 Tax=Anaeromyxobacter dehalogenans (strain ATCC BAA-258 / DSM 21875 / 2CP-1) TaxID=455488 RepID=B8J960_ANAD2|nr:integrase family protein [Anaeromyxobacter dehalogenans 2CP-1]
MSEIRGYIRPRGRKLEAVLVLADGTKRPKATGFSVGEEEQAQRFLDVLLEELRGPAAAAPRPGALTFRAWGEAWIAERKKRGVISVANEEAQLTYHAFPDLGAIPLAELTRARMLEWVRSLPSRRTENTGELLSPRYVHHVAGTVKRLLQEAVDVDHIQVNPCTWRPKRDLPAKRDKKGGKRNQGGLEPGEVWQLIHDERIGEDRRVMYALDLLTGMRPGEVAARRWRDLDTTAEPLWRLHVGTAINSRNSTEKSTKTDVEKVVPVHPLLRELLRSWYAEGWRRFQGRDPTPDDLVVPRGGGGVRTNGHSNKRWKADTERLGLPPGRSHYETRATFRSLAIAGGAQRADLDLITHPSPREAKDVYTRLEKVWPALCRAVLAIELEAPSPATPGVTRNDTDGEVAGGIAVAPAAADPEMEKARRLAGLGLFTTSVLNVGAAGFEPATPAV